MLCRLDFNGFLLADIKDDDNKLSTQLEIRDIIKDSIDDEGCDYC